MGVGGVSVTPTATAQRLFSTTRLCRGTNKLVFVSLPTGLNLVELIKISRVDHTAYYM